MIGSLPSTLSTGFSPEHFKTRALLPPNTTSAVFSSETIGMAIEQAKISELKTRCAKESHFLFELCSSDEITTIELIHALPLETLNQKNEQGTSLIAHALACKNLAFLAALIHKGVRLENLPEENRSFLSSSWSALLSREGPLSNDEIALLQEMIRSQTILPGTLRFIFFRERLCALGLTSHLEEKTEALLKAIADISCDDIHQFYFTCGLASLLYWSKAVTHKLTALEGSDFPHLAALREEVSMWVEKIEQRWKSTTRNTSKLDFISVCTKQQRYFDVIQTISAKLTARSDSRIDPIIFCLLLDKSPPLKKLSEQEGERPALTATLLVEALQHLESDEQAPIFNPLINALSLYASLSLTFEKRQFKATIEALTDEIISLISNSSIDYPIVFPLVTANHCMAIGIEISVNRQSARLTLYNTGQGVGLFHNQLANTNRFHTARSFNLPTNTILNSDFWISLFSSASVRSVYAFFNPFSNEEEPSPTDPFHYERIQVQATCSGQALMAFIRDFSLRYLPGNSLEKWGHYKFFKAHLLNEIGREENLKLASEQIREAAIAKRKKHEADLDLFQTAATAYRGYFNALSSILDHLGEKDFVTEFAPAKTNFEKFALLRLFHKKIADICLIANRPLPDQSSDMLAFASKITTDHTSFAELMIRRVDNDSTAEEFFHYYFNFCYSPFFGSKLIQWLIDKGVQDPLFLIHTRQYFKRAPDLHQKLKTDLEEVGEKGRAIAAAI